MSHPARFRLSIANGGTDSPALSSLLSKGNLRSTLGNTRRITIHAPAALTGVVTVQVRAAYGTGAWNTLQMGDSALDALADVLIGAGKAVDIPSAGIEDLRIHSASAEGAQRDFDLVLQIALGQ